MFVVEVTANAHVNQIPADAWRRLSAHRALSAASARIDRERYADARLIGPGAWRRSLRVVRVTRAGREVLDLGRELERQLLAQALGRAATEAEITAALARVSSGYDAMVASLDAGCSA